MSVDSILEDAVTTILRKAQRPDPETPTRPANLDLAFTGGGAPVSAAAADPASHEIPFPCRIVWAHLYALDGAGHPIAVSATINLRLTQFGTLGASVPLYGTGPIPTLSAQATADLDLTGWHINLVTGDTIIATLASFTGSAFKVGLALQFRPTDVPIGVTAYTDGAGATYTDAAGNPYVFRS